jgi:hypothetical protein
MDKELVREIIIYIFIVIKLIYIYRKRRYFILRRDIKQICYYPSEDQLTLIGTIPINDKMIIWNKNNCEDGSNTTLYIYNNI